VRELENLVRRLAALYPQETGKDESLSASTERHLSKYFGGYGDNLPPPGLYHRILREVETPLLSAALAATRGQPDQGGGTPRSEPEHAAEEDPRPRYSGPALDPLTVLWSRAVLLARLSHFCTSVVSMHQAAGQSGFLMAVNGRLSRFP
jgi:DNA-binding protein Fis